MRRPVTVAELYDALKAYTENNTHTQRSLSGMGWRWNHPEPFLASVRAASVTIDAVEKYKQPRSRGSAMTDPAENDSVKYLKTILLIGAQRGT